MESGLFDMWDYAKKNGKTAKNVWDSFADDLDASVGTEQWRVSRDMDEQPKTGETAVCFTFADGDEQGDFQVFLKRQPKMAIVVDVAAGDVVFAGWSARQASYTASIMKAARGDNEIVYALQMVCVDRPQTRLSVAMDYAETEEIAQRIANSGALDDNESLRLWEEFNL